jgi:hypothetical protein
MLSVYPRFYSYLKYRFNHNQNEVSWRRGEIIFKPRLCMYFTPLLFCVSRLVIKRVGQHGGLFCNHLDLVCNTLESHSWENARTVITCVGLYIIDTGLAHSSTLICPVSLLFVKPAQATYCKRLPSMIPSLRLSMRIQLYKIRINCGQYILFCVP